MRLVVLMAVLFAAASANALEIRGAVAGTVYGASNLGPNNDFTWTPQNFAGFDYDIDRDLGTEKLTIALSEWNRLSGDAPYGIVYEASNHLEAFRNARPDMAYGKLRVASIDSAAGMITLDNKDNTIDLTRKLDLELMPGIRIRTADSETLRFYIYSTVVVE